ncbi:hypothetical protein J7I93_00780 [Bacillus sp. ISL-47]|uniref:hypothetical protein n=1 Tax=Bacillus sp. ISL-47 TaxID=2819130 RepID=UPI001BE960E2|nr:hypothetical protein [Bacillus sp. ISL-47]MBT2686709.1 hypothetical protein [Bacillus sp. ISL-47]MBT2706943.1 hypothetical protein [Pseudomonas sp. ISL-84]
MKAFFHPEAIPKRLEAAATRNKKRYNLHKVAVPESSHFSTGWRGNENDFSQT